MAIFAERLATLLQFIHYAWRALEETYVIGQKPVDAEPAGPRTDARAAPRAAQARCCEPGTSIVLPDNIAFSCPHFVRISPCPNPDSLRMSPCFLRTTQKHPVRLTGPENGSVSSCPTGDGAASMRVTTSRSMAIGRSRAGSARF